MPTPGCANRYAAVLSPAAARLRRRSGSIQQRGFRMKKSIIAAVAVFAAAGLAACSQNAQNESAEAANAIAADTEATTNESVSDVDAATEHAQIGRASCQERVCQYV